MTSSAPRIPPHVPRMAELVALKLRRRIIGGELQDGDELPREAELLEAFGVSRPSLREALRILETEGLVRIRRGKVGGGIVQRPTEQSTAYHVGLTLQSRGAKLSDLAQARAVLEPACAGLAAGRDARTRKKIVQQLTELVDDNEVLLGESYAFTETALRFHAAVVALSGNVTVALLAGSLEAVWSSQERHWAHEATTQGGYPDPKYQSEVLRAHRRVVRAIAEGDVEGATRAMRSHLGKSQPYVSEHDRAIDILQPESSQQASSLR